MDMDSVWVIYERNKNFNCYAWSLGLTNRWIALPNETAIDVLVSFYHDYGVSLSRHKSTASIMAIGNSPNIVAHAAPYINVNQQSIGDTWSSKMGEGLGITHSYDGIQNGFYGTTNAFFKKNTPETTSIQIDQLSNQSFEDIGIHEISKLEKKLINDSISHTSDKTKEEFSKSYKAWETTWDKPEISASSDAADRAKSKEFFELISLGEDIIPLLIGTLQNHTQFFALQALEQLVQPNIIFKPQINDIAIFGGEQLRARETISRWCMSKQYE